MNVVPTSIPGALIFEPRAYADSRGFFMEAYQNQRYREHGLPDDFVQDNFTLTRKGALRGLHYQIPRPQGKLVWAITGEIYDVAVDMRKDSPAFGTWYGVWLTESNRRQFYLPPGTAHGFCVTSEFAHVLYKCTDYYFPAHNRILRWDDERLGIEWPLESPLLSDADAQGSAFGELPYFSAVDI